MSDMSSKNDTKKFISAFKIDGEPIIPPLMTPEKCLEMQQYKLQAIYLERNYLKQKYKKIDPFVDQSQSGLESETTTNDDKYLKISNILRKNVQAHNKYRNEMVNLKQSDTLIYDVISNTVIISSDQDSLLDGSIVTDQDNTKSSPLKLSAAEDIESTCSTTNIHCTAEEDEEIFPPDLDNRNSLPSIFIYPPSPETDKNNRCSSNDTILPPNSPTLKQYIAKTDDNNIQIVVDGAKSLIRSNSFIIDKPSSVLLEHMNQNKIIHGEQKPLTNSKTKTQCTKIITNQSTKTITNHKKKYSKHTDTNVDGKRQNICTNNITVLKNKKSPYDLKLPGKTKLLKKHRTHVLVHKENVGLKKVTTPKKPENMVQIPINKPTVNNCQVDLQKIFDEFEEQHKLKLVDLLKKQREEQQKIQESFENQQKILLEHLTSQIQSTTLNFNYQTKFILDTHKLDDSLNSPNNLDNQIDNNRMLAITTENSTNSERKVSASTTINKYVRGYLTRRLFKTCHVKKISQTIRTTLLFVIDLYKKSLLNNTSENIKLKGQMLEQLNSACCALHNIFFELSTKERMLLISEDRNSLKKNTI